MPIGYANLPSLAEVACSSTTLPCLAVPSGFLMDLDIPSFSRNLVGVGYLKDHGITVTFPVHGRTAIFTNTSNRALLATFIKKPTQVSSFCTLRPPRGFTDQSFDWCASDFCVWGCLALVHDTSTDKLSARTFLCVFLGFPMDTPDFAFYHPPLHRFLDSRDVPPPSPQSSSQSLQQPSALPQQVAVESGDVGAGAEGTSTGGASSEGIGVGGTCTRGASSGGVGVQLQPQQERVEEEKRLQHEKVEQEFLTVFPKPLSDYLCASRPVISHVLSALITHPTAPLLSVSALVATVGAFASSHRLDYTAHLVSGTAHFVHLGGSYFFLGAQEAEMASYRSTSTYIDAVSPPGTNFVNGMRLYKVKRPPGSPPAFKARYVARGFNQRKGIDFFQTFAPTLKMTTLQLHHPPGFTSSFPPGTQWQLRRPDNGLHQAPREWHDTLRTTVAALDFFPSSADLSMFVRRGSTPLFVLVCVDDLVFATPDRHALASVKEELQRRHTCTDLGEVQRYLGLQITRDKAARTITPTQSYMVEQTLTRFRFPFSKVQFPLLAVDHGLTDPPSDEPFESSGSYPELVGCLVYLMTYTRPDLVFPLSVLARFVAPGRHRPSHWLVAKRVAKYVASTSGMGLVLGGKQPVTLIGFSDSSWAHDAEMLRTTQGYCFSLGTGAVSWRSTRASSVSGSSCEAEVYATAVAAQDLCWPSFLLTDLGERPCSPQVLFADNRSAILLCEEPRLVGKAKHIQLRYFLLHELQQRGQALVRHVVSKANTADIFTKALPPCDHQRLCTQLGLVSTCPHLLA
ncbi:unnamed protein product [Closterium sp. NIES-53]